MVYRNYLERIIQRVLACVWFFFPLITSAQLSVKGHIQDGETNKPVALANVFLANTTKGTISKEDGTFILSNLPAGGYDLAISCIGYGTIKISIDTRTRKVYRVILKPSANELAEFKVKSKRSAKWYRDLDLFKSRFIGNSENARHCRILNENSLYFVDSAQYFRAFARDIITIENEGLGYRIKYSLIKFIYDNEKNKIIYEGYPFFEILKASHKDVEKRWVENRKKAYLGSIRHFMQSLYRNKLKENNFFIQKIIEKIDKSGRPRNIISHGTKIKFYPCPADSVERIILPDTLNYNQLIDTTLSNNYNSSCEIVIHSDTR